MKKIIPIFLVVLLFGQSAAYAAEVDLDALIRRHMTDLVDMERVFKYDYMQYQSDIQDEVITETLKQHNAVHAVMALGLMETLENGTFGENEAVPFKTFANIVMRLTTGLMDELEEAYAAYPDTRYTTFHEAAYYLVGAVGYDLYADKRGGEHPRSQVAASIGLLKELDFAGEKNITRGELARMIFNALQIDMVVQTTFGSEEEYEKIKGHTLLSEKFNAALVYGMVTAQNGLNLYTEATMKEDTISIDRASYRLNGYQPGDLLGYRVQAVVCEADDGKYDVLGITVDEKDETIDLLLGSSVYTSGNYLYYEADGKEKRVSLAALERIMLNDMMVSADELIAALPNAEGEIRISQTERGGSYTMAVVRSWSSFAVKMVSVLEDKIHLDHKATFNGKTYIDVHSSNKTVYIEKDGRPVTLGDVPAASVIDVIESKSADSVTILVSGSEVSGTITQTEGKTVYVDGKAYEISSAYLSAQKQDTALPSLTVGKTGTFLLNRGGKIVSYKAEGDRYILGLLKEYARLGSGLDASIGVRIFSEDNEWKELKLAEKLTLDGISDVSDTDAYTILEKNKDKVCFAPVRYELNGDGKVRFLDTAIVNDVERNDASSIIKASTYSGEINWTSDGEPKWSGLTDSKYFYTPSTKFIIMPRDKDKEQDYSIGNKSFLYSEMTVTMDLYNADDFNEVSLIVRSGSASSVLPFRGNYSWMIVTGLSEGVDNDGNPATILNGFESSGGKYVLSSFLLDDGELTETAKSFKKGDLVHFSADGKTMLQMELWCPADEVMTKDIGNVGTTEAQEGLGTVLDVDPNRNVVKVSVNGDESTWYIHCLGLYDRARNKGSVITAGDISPGDRVFGLGGNNYMRVLIIR